MSRIIALFGAFFISMSLHGMELLAMPQEGCSNQSEDFLERFLYVSRHSNILKFLSTSPKKMHCTPEEVEVIPPAPVKEEDIRNGFYATLRPIIGETEVNRAVGGAVMSFPASNRALYNYAKHKKNKKSHSNQIIIHTEVLASSNDANKEDLEKTFWQDESVARRNFHERTNWGNTSSINIEKELTAEPSTMNRQQANILHEFMLTLPPQPKNKHSILLSKIQRFLALHNPVERLRLQALAKDINGRLYWQQFEVQESNDLANRQHRQ